MALIPESSETTSRRSWLKRLSGLLAGGALLGRAQPAAAHGGRQVAAPMGEYCFIGEIMMVAFDYAPRGWAFCNGQLLSINQNGALFSLLGTTYGGDGRNTFALPDLRGRVPVCQGQGPGLSFQSIGGIGGTEASVLTTAQIPAHTHAVPASADRGTTTLAGTTSPATRNYLADSGRGSAQYATAANTTLVGTVQNAGNGQGHENRQPFLGVHFVICLSGRFPSRN